MLEHQKINRMIHQPQNDFGADRKRATKIKWLVATISLFLLGTHLSAQESNYLSRQAATLSIQISINPILISPANQNTQVVEHGVAFRFPPPYKLQLKKDEVRLQTRPDQRGMSRDKASAALRTATYVLE
jgi:hypothetical protein